MKISGAGDEVGGNEGLGIDDPEGVTVTGVDGNVGIVIEADGVTDSGKTDEAVVRENREEVSTSSSSTCM